MRTTVVHGVPYYTIEEENGEWFPSLDIMIHRRSTCPLLSWYRRNRTNKNDFINLFSTHKRTNNDMLTGFVLYAFRVCSVEILEEEIFSFIFWRLHYPCSMLIHLRRKAKEIMNTPKNNEKQDSPKKLIIPRERDNLTRCATQPLQGRTSKTAWEKRSDILAGYLTPCAVATRLTDERQAWTPRTAIVQHRHVSDARPREGPFLQAEDHLTRP